MKKKMSFADSMSVLNRLATSNGNIQKSLILALLSSDQLLLEVNEEEDGISVDKPW